MIRVDGADGLKLAADLSGPSDGQPVLLLHGGGQTRHAWGGTRAALGKLGYRAVALDLRGHGDSDWAPDGDYNPAAIAKDVLSVMARFGGLPAVVGASLGGQSALLAIGESRQEVASALVLVDVTPRSDPEGSRRILSFMRANPNGFASLDEAADAVASYLPHRKRPSDTTGLQRNLRAENGRYRWHWDPRLVDNRDERLMIPTERMLAAAGRLTIPTLLIRGSLSDVVTPETAEEFMVAAPSAEFVTLDQAAHMVAGDRNNRFTTAVTEFLERRLPR
jgi:pimeloyl-ACP methyl ester carboxylesterase